MAIDFPNSPGTGATFTSGGVTWTWDGTKWVNMGGVGTGGLYLPLTGGTVNGPLTVNGQVNLNSSGPSTIDGAVIGGNTPVAGSFTALKATSLNGGPFGFRNRIHNGSGLVDQRGVISLAASTMAATGFITDRWQWAGTQANKMNVIQYLGGGFQFGIVAPLSPAASDYLSVIQCIEGLNCYDLGFGSANAQPVTISFIARSTVTGLHSGSICNKGVTRCYPFTFNISAAGVWQQFAITIPGDTAGTWAVDNTQGLYLRFCFGAGTSLKGAPGVWAGTNYVGATGSVNFCSGTTSDYFAISNIQLEIGSVATPFENRGVGFEMDRCRRYYQRYVSGTAGGMMYCAYAGASGQYLMVTLPISPPMRVPPSCSFIGAWAATNCSAPTIDALNTNASVRIFATASAAGSMQINNPANGGFDLSADI